MAPAHTLGGLSADAGMDRFYRAHRPRAAMTAGDQGPHLTLVWEPGTLVDLNPLGGGICYVIAGADYRSFAVRRRRN